MDCRLIAEFEGKTGQGTVAIKLIIDAFNETIAY